MIESRRSALKRTLVVPVAALLSSGCQADSMIDRKLTFASLDEAFGEAQRLAAVKDLDPGTVWTLPQTLVHLAQSIEFSMAGFPQHRSAIFKRSIGAAAYGVFAWRGRMTHSLAEAIPGAPSLNGETNLKAALARLEKSVQAFSDFSGVLQPHFAYGELSRSQYEQAHAMHLADHFSVIDA